MDDLGVQWNAHPTDQRLRNLTIEWIKGKLEPVVGHVTPRFLASTDVGVTYTERVYEDSDLETKVAMVKYVTLAIYLDDLIDKDATAAKKAQTFMFDTLSARPIDFDYLEQYRQASLHLSSLMSDPLAGNMLLHSCTTFIEGCVLEHRNVHASGAFFGLCNAGSELEKDHVDEQLAARGFSVPRPLGTDWTVHRSLSAHSWPTWLRQKSAVAEIFAITSFRGPGGIDIPIHLWVAVLPEMRTIIMYINDMLSLAKELLADDVASYIPVITGERRQIGAPGSAPDGGWCLRDTIEEVYMQILSTGGRINRLLRPAPEVRYGDGSVRSAAQLVSMLKSDATDELMKALCLTLWETHQKGYFLWHLYSPRYRMHELFDWVTSGSEGAEWITLHFQQNKRRMPCVPL
ncbi:hypothetical protein B0I35DRAFT_443782 [Stachybotrys elegans]|uniref:Uncharacterized protein n=1 Tax=Stachybotrys elegans TaxID=80388 RepID=A0A8K0WKY1_9HYPO|nr:hypothetical protein B0I35DRAFT_443782 [Stachybotrys elegans]